MPLNDIMKIIRVKKKKMKGFSLLKYYNQLYRGRRTGCRVKKKKKKIRPEF